MFEKLKNVINKMKCMIIITIKSTCVGEHEEKNEYDIKSLCMHYILTLWAQTLIKSHLKLKKLNNNEDQLQ